MNCLLIAEIGHNHCGDLAMARDLIYLAKEFNWDIAKFQLYDVDKIKKPGDTNYEDLKAAQLSLDDALMLKEHADKVGIEFLVSVFDNERLSWAIDKLRVNRIKIASRTIFDKDLVNRSILTGKHVIISTAAWEKAIPPDYSGKNIDYLYCKSRRDLLRGGMKGLPDFKKSWYSGFSDHTVGTEWPIRSILWGARILEKHITIDKNLPGWDQAGSADPDDMLKIMRVAKGA